MRRIICIMLLCAFVSFCSCSPAEISSTADTAGPILANVETVERELPDGRIKIDYIQISGLGNPPIMNMLNGLLQDVSTDVYILSGEKAVPVTVTADYAILGHKYISIWTVHTVYKKDADYPETKMNAKIFDLETGEENENFSDFVRIGNNAKNASLKSAIKSSKFVQKHPAELQKDAADTIADTLIKTDGLGVGFYLTQDSFGLYMNGQSHENGGYWAYEAKYSDIKSLLTKDLLKLI